MCAVLAAALSYPAGIFLRRHHDTERYSVADDTAGAVPFKRSGELPRTLSPPGPTQRHPIPPDRLLRYVEGFKQHAPIEEYRFPRDMSIKTKRAITETFTHA